MKLDDDDDDSTVPLFGPADDGPPRRHDLPRCRNCLEALRDDALFCDRCGARQDGPQRTTGGVPWPLVLALGVILGGLLGAGGAAYLVGSRISRLEDDVLTVHSLKNDIARLDRRIDSIPPASPVATAPPVRESVFETPAPPIEKSTESQVKESPKPELPPDNSPSGLRQRLGNSVVSVHAYDDEGAELDHAPGIALAPSRVLTSLRVLAGASKVIVRSEGEIETEVTGIANQDAAYDLVVVEHAKSLELPPLTFTFSPLPSEQEATLLGPISEAKWRESLVKLTPGAQDHVNGGPRLTTDDRARFGGALLDGEGRVIALLVKAGELALPTFQAAPWAVAGSTAIPLEQFQAMAGPGAPTARLKRARQFLAERRFEEAVRLMVQLATEEPRLLPEIRDELSNATLEVAREALPNGAAQNANGLLTEVLRVLGDDGELWAAKGRCLATIGDLVNTSICFRTAITKQPESRTEWTAEVIGILLSGADARVADGLLNDAIQLLLEQRRFFPDNGPIRARVGECLMQAKRFVEASQLFGEAALVDPRIASEMRGKADRARDLAGGPGAIVVDYAPGETKIVVNVGINGSAAARMLLDEGEPSSILPARVIQSAGYSIPSLPRVKFHTDPQAPEVPSVQVASVVVANVTITRVGIIVAEGYGAPYAEGVLGANFLSRFRRVEDASLGRLVLYPR